jgi:chemotaxis protein CheX
MADPVVLESKLDLAASSGLLTTLRSREEDEVILDMSQVKHLGSLCLQVLLSAGISFRAQGRSISFINVSDRVVDQLRVMGMTPETIARGRQ